MTQSALDPADLPSFSAVEAAQVVPRIRAALEANRAAVALAKSEAETLEAFLQAKAAADFELGLAWSPIGHLSSVKDTPELRAAVAEAEPMIVAHELAEAQDAELYGKLVALHGQADLARLLAAAPP